MYTLGVDLGTTFTAAAVWRDGRAEICALGTRSAVIPSVVLARADGTMLTGEAAARRASVDPDRVAREFKRRFGDSTPLLLGGSPYSADALTARLLRAVLTTVTDREGRPPSSVCVSHPANWGPYKTDLLRHAVRMADVRAPVVYTTEPEAAAISYARQERLAEGDTVAVYDLGGGTFDAAVLRRTARGFEILGQPEGIERLGGVDVDAVVYAHVERTVGEPLTSLDEDDPAATAAVARLRTECTEAKEALSSDTDVTIPVLLPSLSTEVRLTRAELEDMVRPSLYDSIEALKRALRSAAVEPDGLSAVLLVGGASRMPLVAQLVGSELGRPVAVDTHPKHAVALGAGWVSSGAVLPTDPEVAAAAAAAGTPPPPILPRRAAPPSPSPSAGAGAPVAQRPPGQVAGQVAGPVVGAGSSAAGAQVAAAAAPPRDARPPMTPPAPPSKPAAARPPVPPTAPVAPFTSPAAYPPGPATPPASYGSRRPEQPAAFRGDPRQAAARPAAHAGGPPAYAPASYPPHQGAPHQGPRPGGGSRPADPRLADPRLADPRLADPRLAAPGRAGGPSGRPGGRWLLLAVAVIAILALGGGGYYYVSTSGSGSTALSPQPSSGSASPTGAGQGPTASGQSVGTASNGAEVPPASDGGGPVNVRVAVVGSGAVTGGPARCDASCTLTLTSGRATRLHAQAATGYAFTSWAGCSQTSGPDCTVRPHDGTAVTVTFSPSGTTTTATTAPTTTTTTTSTTAPTTTTTSTSAPSVPGSVGSVSVSAPTSTTLGVDWTTASGATRYRVRWTSATDARGSWTSTPPDYSGTHVTLTNLLPNTAYTVTVTPYNAAGNGGAASGSGHTTA